MPACVIVVLSPNQLTYLPRRYFSTPWPVYNFQYIEYVLSSPGYTIPGPLIKYWSDSSRPRIMQANEKFLHCYMIFIWTELRSVVRVQVHFVNMDANKIVCVQVHCTQYSCWFCIEIEFKWTNEVTACGYKEAIDVELNVKCTVLRWRITAATFSKMAIWNKK